MRRTRRSGSTENRLAVHYQAFGSRRQVGVLAWDRGGNRSYFQFSAEFLETPLPLSPATLRPAPTPIEAPHDPFSGLHGLFHDSLPDGWGTLLLDRRLKSIGVDPGSLTPLDRLALIGRNGMGALAYEPERTSGPSDATTLFDLDHLADEAGKVQDEVATADVEKLLDLQGGSGGARPKIVAVLDETTQTLRRDDGSPLKEGRSAWIVKFASRQDPIEMGVEEYAYSLMAKGAGIDMPRTRLLETQGGGRFFAVERFDRSTEGRRHVHTVSGLLHASHRYSSIDYRKLLDFTRWLTRDEREVARMFRRLAFNVFAHNRDDHTKNHAFMMDRDGLWKATPAYDLTFSSGPRGFHSLQIADEAGDPTLRDVMKAAETAGLPKAAAAEIVDHVRSAVDDWAIYADEAGLSPERRSELDFVLNGRGPKPDHDVEVALPSPP